MLDLNTAPVISHSTTAMPTFLEIMQFLKKRVRFDIESDRPFVTLDRDFLIAAIFECCLTLRLCERSPTFQKLLQLNPHFSGDLKTSLTFTHKFVIVHEVFTKLLQYDDISLTDFIQPEQKKIKGLFGALMHYANRHDFFVGQFTQKLAHFKLLKEEVQAKQTAQIAADRRLTQLEMEKVAERPVFDQFNQECKSLTAEINQLKADLKSRRETHLGIEFLLEEVSIKLDSKNRELVALKEKARDLTNHVVHNEQELLDSKSRINETLHSLTAELKDLEDRVQQAEKHKAQIQKHLALLETLSEQSDQLVKKRASLVTAKASVIDGEAKAARIKRDIEELDQNTQNLQDLEQGEALNSEGIQTSLNELQNKIDHDVKVQENQIKSAEEVIRELKEQQRELEAMSQSCQATIVKLLEQQAVVFGALEELFVQINEKSENYRQSISKVLEYEQ